MAPAVASHLGSFWWKPLFLACGLGAAAGFLHVVAVLFRRIVLGTFTWTSRDILWMSPLGNVMLLVCVALPFAMALAWRPGVRLWRVAVITLATLSAISALLAIRALHTWAVSTVENVRHYTTEPGSMLASTGPR